MRLDEYFPASRIPAMQEHLRRFAAGFGIGDFRTSDRIPNTRRALGIAELAREKGRLDAFRDAAMNAYWRDGRDLESDDVLRAAAAEAGLDADAAIRAADAPEYQARVDAIRAEASRIGVTGIPTFVFGDRLAVVGCQSYEVLAGAAEQAGGRRRT